MTNKIALFIDKSNVFASEKALNFKLDYIKFCNFIEQEFNWQIWFKGLYLAYPDETTRDRDVSWVHRLAHALKKKHNFIVRKKRLKQIIRRDSNCDIIRDSEGNPKYFEKWNMDVEITIDAISKFPYYDTFVFCSGDSDFDAVFKYLTKCWKKVYAFSSKWSISKELRLASKKFYDFKNILEEISQVKNDIDIQPENEWNVEEL